MYFTCCALSLLPVMGPTESNWTGSDEQTIWNPIFGVMFFTYLGLAEGKSFDDIQKKIKNDLATAVMGSWTVWIPAHTVNFKFVPTSQRLLYINTIQARLHFSIPIANRKDQQRTAFRATKQKRVRMHVRTSVLVQRQYATRIKKLLLVFIMLIFVLAWPAAVGGIRGGGPLG